MYTLLITLIVMNNGHVTVTSSSMEYGSKKACSEAAELIESAYKKAEHPIKQAYLVCTRKG